MVAVRGVRFQARLRGMRHFRRSAGAATARHDAVDGGRGPELPLAWWEGRTSMPLPAMPPTTIDRNLLHKLADLARLHVPAERQSTVLQNLQRIVAAFDALRSLSTGTAPGAAAATGTPLRPDLAEAPLAVDQVLANAPQQAGGMFVVPRVVDA